MDSGVASYMDEVTRAAFAEVLANHYRKHPDGNYYSDVLEAEFKRSARPDDPEDLGRWNVHLLPGTDLNIVMFSGGLGDGRYESWWGVGENGGVVSLVTDFRLL